MMQISIIFSKKEVLSFRILPKHYKTIVFIDVSIYSCKVITFDSIQFAWKLNQKQWKI